MFGALCRRSTEDGAVKGGGGVAAFRNLRIPLKRWECCGERALTDEVSYQGARQVP